MSDYIWDDSIPEKLPLILFVPYSLNELHDLFGLSSSGDNKFAVTFVNTVCGKGR